MALYFQVAALWLLVNGGIGAALGRAKGLTLDGVVYGCLLGPLGWLVVLLKQPTIGAQVRRERELRRALREPE